MYPLSAYSLPVKALIKAGSFSGWRSSTFPPVSIELSSSPLLLTTRCSLKPKKYPMVDLPSAPTPSKTLFRDIRLFLHTRSGVESMKEIPVDEPIQQVFTNMARGRLADAINSTYRL